MRYVSLGKTAVKISVIGFGCWAIGGRQWGPTDDGESKRALGQAFELGINFFDTADYYGLGHSEELLGQTLGARDDVVIATKVGLRWNKKGKVRHDLSPQYIRQACEDGLRRLCRETIDLYQLHWPDPDTPLEKTAAALDELVREGKVRYVGASNYGLKELEFLASFPWFVSAQGKFNLFHQSPVTEIIPFCRQHDLAFIAYQPLAKGLLTGKFIDRPVLGRGDHRKYDERFTVRFAEFQPEVDRFARLADRLGATPAQLALAALPAKGATAVIPGIKTPEQAIENAAAADLDPHLLQEVGQEAFVQTPTLR